MSYKVNLAGDKVGQPEHDFAEVHIYLDTELFNRIKRAAGGKYWPEMKMYIAPETTVAVWLRSAIEAQLTKDEKGAT